MSTDWNDHTATLRPPLAEVVGHVLADLAFLMADEPADSSGDEAYSLQAEIRYSGPHNGRLRCWCTAAFANQLAANLLGVEVDEDSAVSGGVDAVRELMNVICGQLVTSWYGREAVFNLSIPTVSQSAPIEPGEPGESCRLWCSGEPLRFAHNVN